jgi:hypothetical protein
MNSYQPPPARRPAQSVHSDAKLSIVYTLQPWRNVGLMRRRELVDARGMADQGLVEADHLDVVFDRDALIGPMETR